MSPIVNFNDTEVSTEEFRKWRQEKGMTIPEATNLFGYTNQSAIYQIESGVRKVPKRVALTMQLIKMSEEK
jgi:hypothetical protein